MIDVTDSYGLRHNHSKTCAVASPRCSGTDTVNPIIDPNRLLSYGASYRRVKEGEIIFMEGAPLTYYYQLVSGAVRWINLSDEGHEFIQDIILPGESFGELPLFDDQPYAATAVAQEDSLMFRLPKSVFHQLLEENPEVHFAFSKLMSERIRFKFLMLKESAFHDPSHRLRVLLSHLKKSKRHFCSLCNKVTLTRQQLADMTGLRVETVIRTIKQLETQGMLSIQRGKVYY